MEDIVKIVKSIEVAKGKDKEKILKENKDNELLKKILIYTYDKDKKFKLSKKSINPRSGESIWIDFFTMLDELSESNINDSLRINVNRFLGGIDSEEVRDLMIKVILKDLKIGVSVKTINKAIDGLIFDFQVMKASSYNEKTSTKFNREANKNGYTMMIKENGERLEAIKENGIVTLKSRQNKVYEGLVDLEKAFNELMPNNYVYEGELLAFNPQGKDWETSEEQFKLTNKILHTLGDKHGIYVSLFDMIPLDDFKKGKSEIFAIDRKNKLKECVDLYSLAIGKNFLQYSDPLYIGNDTSLIQPKLEEVSDNSYKEGLMVVLNNSIYESKRVNQILKCKIFSTMDLKVIGLKESVEKPNTLGSLILDFKNEEQGCSGLSDELKELWWNNPNEIIGKIIECKYKAITKDKDGKESLQFCNFVRQRFEKDEISYE
ncbi:MAG: hypothetical protein RR359_03325 [Bacilli bacterium]